MLNKSNFWILFISERVFACNQFLLLEPIGDPTNTTMTLSISHYGMTIPKTLTYHNVHCRYIEEPVPPLVRH